MRSKITVRTTLTLTLVLALGGAVLAGEARQNRRELRHDRQERRDDRRDVGRLESLRSAYAEATVAQDAVRQKAVEGKVLRFAGLEIAEGNKEARRDAAELGRSRREVRRSRRDAAAEGEPSAELRDDRRDRRDDRRDARKTLRANAAFEKAAREFRTLYGALDAASVERKEALLDEMVALERQELRRDRREHREDRREVREDRS